MLERCKTKQWFVVNKLRIGQRVRKISLIFEYRGIALTLIIASVEAVGFCGRKYHISKERISERSYIKYKGWKWTNAILLSLVLNDKRFKDFNIKNIAILP